MKSCPISAASGWSPTPRPGREPLVAAFLDLAGAPAPRRAGVEIHLGTAVTPEMLRAIRTR